MNFQATIDQTSSRVAEFRHRLHRIPELGYEEFKTAAAIRAELDGLGIEHVDGVPDAPTATIAWIGDTSKPCVALRADIDALPIFERTGLAYASTHEGRMHACGHDGHTATLMGTAGILKSMATTLAGLREIHLATRRRRRRRRRAAGRGRRARWPHRAEGPRHLRPAWMAGNQGRHRRHQARRTAGRHRYIFRDVHRPRLSWRVSASGPRSDRDGLRGGAESSAIRQPRV